MSGMTLGEAEEVRDSTYWTFIRREIEHRITLKTKALRTCSEQHILDRLNAAIDTLEEVAKLPEDVIERES